MTKSSDETQQAHSDQLLAIRLQRQFDRENNLIDGAGDGESSADRNGDREEEQCRADFELARRLAEDDVARAPPLQCRSDFLLAHRLAEDDGAPPLSPRPSRRGMIESGARRDVESAPSARHQATRQIESAVFDDELWRQLKTSFLEAKNRKGVYASVPSGRKAAGSASAAPKPHLTGTDAPNPRLIASEFGLSNAKVDALVKIGWLAIPNKDSLRSGDSSTGGGGGGFWSSLFSRGGEKLRDTVLGRSFFLADAMLEQIELVACLQEANFDGNFAEAQACATPADQELFARCERARDEALGKLRSHSDATVFWSPQEVATTARSLLNVRLERLGNADETFFEGRKGAFLTAEKMRMFAESELGAVCVYSAQTFHGGFMHLLLDCIAPETTKIWGDADLDAGFRTDFPSSLVERVRFTRRPCVETDLRDIRAHLSVVPYWASSARVPADGSSSRGSCSRRSCSRRSCSRRNLLTHVGGGLAKLADHAGFSTTGGPAVQQYLMSCSVSLLNFNHYTSTQSFLRDADWGHEWLGQEVRDALAYNFPKLKLSAPGPARYRPYGTLGGAWAPAGARSGPPVSAAPASGPVSGSQLALDEQIVALHASLLRVFGAHGRFLYVIALCGELERLVYLALPLGYRKQLQPAGNREDMATLLHCQVGREIFYWRKHRGGSQLSSTLVRRPSCVACRQSVVCGC